MSADHIVLLPIFTSRPGAASEVAEHLAILESASRADAGCLEYTVYRDVSDKNRFVLFERWADADSLALHNEQPHIATFGESVRDLLAEPLTVPRLTPLTPIAAQA